jgi:hypothetical protein
LLDQGFNQKNFRRIYDSENRKGANLEERFCLVSPEFDELKRQTTSIKDLKIELRNAIVQHRQWRSEETLVARTVAVNNLRQSVQRKQHYLDEYLNQLASRIAGEGHNLTLTSHPIVGGKTLFLSQNDPATFFIEKQIQYNISRLYKIFPGNRDVIVPQVISFCTGKLPFWGIRTDVSDFYETIDHPRLLKLLKADQLLDAPSIRYIQQVLFSYRQTTGSAVGLPRGNGISAYLAELFMRPIDSALKSGSDVLFYARYVDDIFIVYAESPEWIAADRLAEVQAEIRKHGLSLNPQKTTEISNTDPSKAKFNYLGYEYHLRSGRCEVDITKSKKDRYLSRLTKCFEVYTKAPSRKKSAAGRILLKRIVYLTSNTKLLNSKSNAYIGVYYSSRYITTPRRYSTLDAALRHKVSSIADPRLRNRLGKYSFQVGFEEQRFAYFKQAELTEIVRIWKYE